MGQEYTKESSYVEEIRCLVVFLSCFKIFFDVGLCCLTINRGENVNKLKAKINEHLS